MKQRQVYINGERFPEEEAKISIFDSAVLIGDSVIETARTFHRKLFRWPEHRDRLLRSIKAARMNFSLTTEELDRVTQKFLDDNLPTLEDGDEGGVGHLVSRGRMGLVLPPTESTFVMYFYPLSTGLKAKAVYYDKGLHVVTPPTRHMHPLTIDPKIKYRSRLHFSLADAEARLIDPEALPLMLDHQGNLAEGTGWNFFVVNRGRGVDSQRAEHPAGSEPADHHRVGPRTGHHRQGDGYPALPRNHRRRGFHDVHLAVHDAGHAF